MGSFCSVGNEQGKPKRLASYNTIEDILFNAGLFIQENHNNFFSTYTLLSLPIGYGSYGQVWVCDHIRSKERRAVKIIDKLWLSSEMIEKKSVLTEIDILKTLDYPNVLKIYEYFEDERYYYILMEYLKDGDLFDELEKVGKFEEDATGKIMSQILSGLNYIHNKKIIHRDIKLENILISSKEKDLKVKIIDFNIATFNVGKKLSKFTGTSYYIAPEVIKENYNEKCDVWSCGVIMYLLLSGNFPFDGKNRDEILDKISTGKFNLKDGIWEQVSRGAKDLLSNLLEKNPKKRFSAKQALEHNWIEVTCANQVDEKFFKKTLTKMFSITKKPKLAEVFQTFLLGQVQKNNKELQLLERVFNAIDEDRNGVISKNELVDRLKLEMSEEKALKEVDRVFSLTDNDGSGVLDYTEFLRAALEEESYVCRENLRKAFIYFDKDLSNSIEKQELMAWLSEGAIIPMNVIEELIEEADKNGDGEIDLEEFENLLLEKISLEDQKNVTLDELDDTFSEVESE